MKLNYSIFLALAFGAWANAAANKPVITSSPAAPHPPPESVVTIPCSTSTAPAESTTVCHECPPHSTIPPFRNSTSPVGPPVTPPGTAPGTAPATCIHCPSESTAAPVVTPITITTTTFVTVPCETPTNPGPPLNTAPTNVVPPQNTGPPAPAFSPGPLVPSQAVPPPSPSIPVAPAPPEASSRPAVPAGPPSPAPSPAGPAKPPAFTGAGSILTMDCRGFMMTVVVAVLTII